MTASPDTALRADVVRTVDQAIAAVQPGAVVGIGGSVTAGHPMALVRALARAGTGDLTLVSPTAGLDVDLLVSTGQVRKVVTSYVGAEGIAAVGPSFRAAVETGVVDVWDADEAHCVLGLRAAAQGLPFLPWLGGVGTALPELNPDLVEFTDPIAGRTLIAVPAIPVDVALIFAEVADRYGNVQFAGTGYIDPVLASAATRVIVQVERIVANDVIRRDPGRTWFWRDVTVVPARWGTHPYSCAELQADGEHLGDYAAAAAAASRGDRSQLETYLARYVSGPGTHEDYLEQVGIRTISRLVT